MLEFLRLLLHIQCATFITPGQGMLNEVLTAKNTLRENFDGSSNGLIASHILLTDAEPPPLVCPPCKLAEKIWDKWWL